MVRKALAGALASAGLLFSPVSPLSLLSPAPAAASDADGRTAAELAERAKHFLLDAESVRLTMTDRIAEAEGTVTEPSAMDLALDRDGNCVGTIETGGEGGGRVEIVKRGEEVLKPDAAFWKAHVPGGEGDAVAGLLKDRYLHGTTDESALEGMAGVCDLAGSSGRSAPGRPPGTPPDQGRGDDPAGHRGRPADGRGGRRDGQEDGGRRPCTSPPTPPTG
ncbi:hypothetical protein SGLAM104S_07053 [Streptomyces glaucescens]